jgi:L-ascorbate 6-phosphate lactonase
MTDLSQRIAEARVAAGTTQLWWLGQAGFAFKTSGGTVVYVDPYLSDAVMRTDSFRRMSLAPIAAADVMVHLFIVTHEHTDHLDPDAIPVIAASNPECQFIAPSGSIEGLRSAGVKAPRIKQITPGDRFTFRDVTVHSGKADHGAASPSAISLCLDLAGVKIMLSGDGSWRSDYFAPLYALGLDAVIPCINGTFGNMNHLDAARMAGESGAPIAIPCHFWMFAEHGACDPLGFTFACQRFAPKARAQLLSPGEGLVVSNKAV